jgi:hypothetical protein
VICRYFRATALPRKLTTPFAKTGGLNAISNRLVANLSSIESGFIVHVRAASYGAGEAGPQQGDSE